ncbi:MAG TPA: ATP-binding protein, partial [Pseudonocardiaceae bacterium]|nr:ATP-binding protein [Pseudonocardiaceae bacterium]
MATELPVRRRFPPTADAPRRARAALRQSLRTAGLDDHGEFTDTLILLASELFDNALLHAGTEFDFDLDITGPPGGPRTVTVAVSDHGTSPLEQHLARLRPRTGRAASHGRGLMMVQRLAT